MRSIEDVERELASIKAELARVVGERDEFVMLHAVVRGDQGIEDSVVYLPVRDRPIAVVSTGSSSCQVTFASGSPGHVVTVKMPAEEVIRLYGLRVRS